MLLQLFMHNHISNDQKAECCVSEAHGFLMVVSVVTVLMSSYSDSYLLFFVSIDTVLSLDVFKKGAVFASCAKVSTQRNKERNKSGFGPSIAWLIFKKWHHLFMENITFVCCACVFRTSQCACGTWTVTVVRCDVWHRAPATLMPWALSHAPGNTAHSWSFMCFLITCTNTDKDFVGGCYIFVNACDPADSLSLCLCPGLKHLS